MHPFSVLQSRSATTRRTVPRILSRRQLLLLSQRGASATRSRCFSTSTNQQAAQPPPNDESSKTTHFGYETVAESLKASKVGAVFSSVASSYDTMNDLMSLGIHRLWKDHFVRSINPGSPSVLSSSNQPQGWNILDVAGGTGDIALRLLDHSTLIHNDHATRVTIADINPDMLAEGKKRLADTAYMRAGRVSFMEANAESMPDIPSNSLDLYTVAFGIRNFTHKDAAIREAYRILKPGGVFACLEFTPQLRNPVLNGVYKRWSFGAIPLIGQLVAGDRDSYQYLVESIERFPSQERFRDMIKEAGLLVPGGEEGKGWEDLSLGIAAVHKGVKPVRW